MSGGKGYEPTAAEAPGPFANGILGKVESSPLRPGWNLRSAKLRVKIHES